MNTLRLLVFLFITSPLFVAAQVPYYTEPDSAQMRKMRENKVHFVYTLEQPFDSVTGKLKTKAPYDTIATEFRRDGREIEFTYCSGKVKSHNRKYYDAEGKVIRHFSYDDDSTNGFIHYYSYNDKSQVVREISYTREGKKEVPFLSEEFRYDEFGNLVVQESYQLDEDGSNSLEDISHFLYLPGDMTVEIGLTTSGDTSFVDTTVNPHEPGPYYSRRYTCLYGSGPRGTKNLVADCWITYDTLGRRVKEISSSTFFSYSSGEVTQSYNDTIYSDLKGNTLEVYSIDFIENYFYDDKGEFEYMIRYNRQHQPLYRRTQEYIYYK